jgi:integrase
MLDLQTLSASDHAALTQLLMKLKPGEESAVAAKPKKRAKSRTKSIKYFTKEETDRFFKVIDSPRDRAIFRVMYLRGLRASEVGMIQLADWNISRDRIVFERLKGSNGGEYHLFSSEVRALKAWLRVRGSDPGPLFPSRLGKGISRKMLHVLVRNYGAKAGLPTEKCHCHAFKHSVATHMLDKGESLEDVQDQLGHVNIQSTLVYAKFTNVRRQARDKRLRDW